jgi:hypothetical protein
MTSSYLDYERTIHKAAAHRLNDFDSKLVLKKLANLGEKNASREEFADEPWISLANARHTISGVSSDSADAAQEGRADGGRASVCRHPALSESLLHIISRS